MTNEQRFYDLGVIRVDAVTLTATARGATLSLGAKAVRALAVLCANAGEVVTRSALIAAAWGAEPVDDSSLWQSIYLLRRTLAAHDAPNRIENVRGRGYRLTGPIAASIKRNADRAPSRRAGSFALLCLLLAFCAVGPMHRSTELTGESARLLRLGRYYFEGQTLPGLQRSEAILKQLIGREPRSARAFAALANTEAALVTSYGPSPSARTALHLAESASTTALRLDPDSAAAMTSAATVAEVAAERFGIADASYTRALTLDPRDADAHLQYGVSLLMRGRLDEAIGQLRTSAGIDPTTAGVNAWLAFAYYVKREPSAALPFAVQALYLGDDIDDAHAVLGMIYAKLGNVTRAAAEFRLLRECCPRLSIAYTAQAYAQSGRTPRARALLRRIRLGRGAPPLLWLNVAFAQIMLDERQEALRSLRHAAMSGAMGRCVLALDPRLDPVRNDRRFAAFAEIPNRT